MNSPSSIVCSDKKNFYFHILIALKVDFENDKNDFDKNDRNTKIRLTPYGASLIVLDFPVTFHLNCLSPLLSSRPW